MTAQLLTAMPCNAHSQPRVLWWARSGREYSRNRIMRQAFAKLDWVIDDFSPLVSVTAVWEASLRRLKKPDIVWIPCFCHRDAAAATRWAKSRGVPVVFDPLISAYDKQVFERRKFDENSRPASRLLQWESRLMRRCDLVVADTVCHADFFAETIGVAREKLAVLPVGAEEELFVSQPLHPVNSPPRILFYGSFIGLQGPELIVEAARLAPEFRWTLVGDGPLKPRCVEIAGDADHIEFIPWVPYAELPRMIGSADILLGIFGNSGKAARVIPNKVFQSLACGRPVITRNGDAYPCEVRSASIEQTGLTWVPAGNPQAIVAAVRSLVAQPDRLRDLGSAARATYEQWFSEATILDGLRNLLAGLVCQGRHAAVRR